MSTQSTPTPLRVLILEDSKSDAALIWEELERAGFEPAGKSVDTKAAFLDHLAPDLDVVLADYDLPGYDGLRALDDLREQGYGIPLIIVTGVLDQESATHLMEKGVANYILKDRLKRLGPAVRQAIEQTRLREETRKALEAFRESESRYRTLVENARDVVFHLDSSGRITLLNRAFEDITGWMRDEWIDRPFSPIVHRDDRAFAIDLFEQALGGNRLNPFELRIERKEGGSVTCEFTVAQHCETDGTLSVLGIARDVTERKRLEFEFRQSQKMDSLGELAGGIAHDFNNLIGIITGYSEFAMESLEEDHPAREHLRQIDAAGQRASSLVQGILTFAQKKQVSLVPLQINQAIDEITQILHETLPKTVEIERATEENLPEIPADPSQINQVLMNLCLNARDAMPDGGKLTLRTRCLPAEELPSTFTARAEQPYVCVSVSDEGVGIPDDVRQSIFEPFFTTKKSGRGSGLGLAVVHGIVKSHHGYIDVSSEPGTGTTFHLYFPASAEPSAAPDTSPSRSEARNGTETILLVEDEPNIRKLTTMSLRKKGYRVLTAPDGSKALSLFKERHREIALVLLDLGLPKVDGLTVLEKIKGIDPAVKVILASGYLDAEQKERLDQSGSNDFLQKPYELKEMLRRIQALLHSVADG